MRRGGGAPAAGERRIVPDEEDALGGFAPGALVRHPQFGEGTILSLTKAGPNSRVQVRFRAAGVKTLVLQYARLERM
jgi:DNA helicase-2/ATP-dependent DNA helicase PcrA